MSQEKRVKRIETSLTPKQAVLLWLKESQQLGLVAYTEKQFNSPMHEAPRTQLTETVGSAVSEKLRKQGMKAQFISCFARQARKETDFLIVLAMDLQNEVHHECVVNEPYFMLLWEKLKRMLEHLTLQNRFEPEIWELWRGVLILRLRTLLLLRDILGAISERYFDHQPLLFREETTDFEAHIRALEELVKHYNCLKGGIPVWTAIEFNTRVSEFKEQVAYGMRRRVANAKSTTLRDFGESEEAWKMVQPYALASLAQLRASTLKSRSLASLYPYQQD